MAKEVLAEEQETILSTRLRRQLWFWLFVFVGLVIFLYVFRSILLPFIAGMALAYFLDPVADRLEAWGVSRLFATILILLSFVVLFTLVLIVLVPLLSTQLTGLIERMPGYVTSLQAIVTDTNSEWIEWLAGKSELNIRENLDGLLKQGAGWLTTLLGSIWNSGKALLDVISLFVITPIVAFYLLLDWDKMVARVDGWLPRDHKQTIRSIVYDIDAAIAGFVRGQGSVCLILGTFYAIGLTLVGLNFGLLIGMFAGIISFIPFVGSIIGLVISVGVALVQFWPEFWWVFAVACVFFVGQFFEGNILQPKLVGESVGLHPVWLMFSLSAFGVLLGFTGLLIAVPVAAAIGVLVRFALSRYTASHLYLGEGNDAAGTNSNGDDG
ncbi:MAG: AI-2E family transporter [Rhizobiaceae bacterium]